MTQPLPLFLHLIVIKQRGNPHTQIYPRINLNSNFSEPGPKPGFSFSFINIVIFVITISPYNEKANFKFSYNISNHYITVFTAPGLQEDRESY